MAESKSVKRKFDDVAKAESKPSGTKKFAGHWSQGLLASMNDPDLIVEKDDKLTVIKDKYPKAKHHFLVMPKETIPNLKSLKQEHLDLLKHMEKIARDVAQRTDKKIKFRFGYHAVPSMSHLHLHAISQDFDSPSLKTKKHWNSFTSPYFVDSSEVIKRLEKEHKVDFNQKENTEYLSLDLKCHVCGRPMKNMPSLKSHIRTHSYTCDS
ncbi:aprataxin-like [Mya arenaria]|uniref:aprataxin-like n=1 Tax=Mya arenaria TaxID=6604 RepID=UPI0022E713DA|nr:aprataxin-like [Mya arenaria]